MSARQVAVALLVGAAVVLGTADPAAAHGGQGAERSPAANYRTSISAVTPDAEGLEVRVREAGSRIELTNRTGKDITVSGYEGEPYLRITPNGVFENTRSPATYLNRDRRGRAAVPATADASAVPEWRKVTGGATARWHDHRAHWMGGTDPPVVRADRSSEHVVIPQWNIPLDVDGRPVIVTGELTWVPGPSRRLWLSGAALIGLAALVALRRYGRPMVATVGGALLAATIVEAAGAWGASVDSAAAKLTDLVTPALAWFVLLAGLTQLRRAPREAGLLVGAAAAGLGWLFGIADLSWLGASQLPTTLAPPLARTAIAVSLGCGAALVLHAAVSARDLLRHPTAASVRPPPVSGDTADRAVDVSAGLWRRYRWVLVGGVGAVVILSAAVLAGGSGDDPGTSPAPAPRDVHAELCAVLAIDDPAQAAARFAARVHDPLHRLIDDLVHDDRALAERLRSAKQRVEVAYADRSALPRQLEALEPVVREALAARGVRTQPCPDG